MTMTAKITPDEPAAGLDRTSTPPAALPVRVWRLFTAFRRTRPFWGGVWMILGGADIIYWTHNPLAVVISGGWSASAGFILGGAMIVFALVGWFAPLYKTIVGVVGMLLALVAFIAANLGGFLIGSVLGVIGGAMVWGWGPKRPRRASRTDETHETDATDATDANAEKAEDQ